MRRFPAFDRRNNPSGISVSTSGQTFGDEADVDRFISILKNKYGYDPGGKDEFIRTVNSNKVFGRADFNISSRHQLVARHNFNDSLNDIGRPTTFEYFMPDAFYRIKNKTNSSVVQLNGTPRPSLPARKVHQEPPPDISHRSLPCAPWRVGCSSSC